MGLWPKKGRESPGASVRRTPGARPHGEPFNDEKDALLLEGDPVGPPRSGRRVFLWLTLAAYVGFLFYRGLSDTDANPVLWRWNGVNRISAWILGLALTNLREFAYFVPVGVLTAIGGFRRPTRGRGLLCEIEIVLVAGLLAIVACAGGMVQLWPAGISSGLLFPLLGGFFGAWAGVTWLRGWRARLWLLPKAALAVLAPVLCLGILVWLSLEAKPLSVDAAQVTSEEKRRLVSLLRSKDPRSLEEGQTHTLTLTDHDLDVLLAWGLSVAATNAKAGVDLEPGIASLSLSAEVPFCGGIRYLNVLLSGGAEIRDAAVVVNVSRCAVGSVQAPRWLLNLCVSWAVSKLNQDPRSRPFVNATREIAIGSGSVDVTYGSVDLPPGYRESLFGPSLLREEVLASARVQIAHLLEVVGQTPKMKPTFESCMETVFSLARDRSREGDPVTENHAAILALGSLLGHSRVEEFLGPVHVEARDRIARRALSLVRLRGRIDWRKHFCVSAAIALFSNERVSDAAGLLKEELDAGQGGSGFSFGDLLADRAGTVFAVCATRDRAAAVAVQNRIAAGFRIEEFFPTADDLPEGISDAQLQAQYGGVGGQAYREWVAEIERRVAACAAYR